jgi:hypothetical protein
LLQTDISFDGTLSSSWAKIAIGMPLFVVIALQQVTLRMARRRRFGAAGASTRDTAMRRRPEAQVHADATKRPSSGQVTVGHDEQRDQPNDLQLPAENGCTP